MGNNLLDLNNNLESSVAYNELRRKVSDTIITNFFNLAYRFSLLGDAVSDRARAKNVAYNDSDLLDAYTQLATSSTVNRAQIDNDTVRVQIDNVKQLLILKANLSAENIDRDSSALSQIQSQIDPMVAESIDTNIEFVFQDYDDTQDDELDKRARFIDDFLDEKSFPIKATNY